MPGKWFCRSPGTRRDPVVWIVPFSRYEPVGQMMVKPVMARKGEQQVVPVIVLKKRSIWSGLSFRK